MTSTDPRRRPPELDDPVTQALVATRRFFTRAEVSSDQRALHKVGGRDADTFYRDRWSHDKVVRSTHGVNCTGSCSWKVYVKDGIITWESQQTDYPSVGPDRPEYEPRGCPRGAAFSWYTYSPTRVRYPYVRGVLLEMYREARSRLGDPVLAWADVVEDPVRAARYKSARGKGGLVRASWDEASEIVAAAHVHTIKRWGPDRVAGFSPIPAMSMVSHASGARFVNLIGGSMLSFYDWYADLPVASPQVFGDQTDVPESGDWWDAGYLIMWGSNLPVTRTPDAHWMTEARYRGQKVIAVAPDYADNVKFADEWLAPRPGTDGALAMAMGHVILKEFFVDRQVPYFSDYVSRYTDLPFLIRLDPVPGGGDGAHPGGGGDPAYVSGKFLTAEDLGGELAVSENAAFKTVLLDGVTGEPVVPNGSLGHRYGDDGIGKWNLDLGDVVPMLSVTGGDLAPVQVQLPRFDEPTGASAVLTRGVPVRRVNGHLVTTVFDLMLAQYGVARDGMPGSWPTGYDDVDEPYTPAWQEVVTGVPAAAAARIGREFAANAEESTGRSMIIMGAGTNHWFHSDTIYRSFLTLTNLTGCQGVNGGGWAHYVGQEKVRPITGFGVLAFATDWARPPRQMATTSFWYLATDQYRYERFGAEELASPLGEGRLKGKHFADCVAQSARMGWLPSYPSLNRNPLDLCDEAQAAGRTPQEHVIAQLKSGELRFAAEDPDDPANFPRILTLWRANLLGSSSKGHEYFLRHLLGVDKDAITAQETAPEGRPQDVVWRDEAPTGKLDLFTTIDFRMNGSALYSDIVLPAATWYEKNDIASTDLHPFVHSFNQAVPPPWETRTDWDAFNRVAAQFQRLAKKHLGVRQDLVVAPLLHDTPEELAQPGGVVLDWKAGECEPIPGKTMPKLVVVERDYGTVHDKMTALGPLVETAGIAWKGISWKPEQEVEDLRRRNGIVRSGIAEGRPQIVTDIHAAEVVLRLSGTTNGRLAVEGFKFLEQRTGTKLADLAEDREDERITISQMRIQPRKVITSPEWSGIESRTRRYSPFTVNVERDVPWRTLTGRQHFYLDHDWMLEFGEGLPAYRPPLAVARHEQGELEVGDAEVLVKWITPHSKWSIHSEFQDNLHMLTLFRGGPVVWLGPGDAKRIGAADNDWVEIVNRNGVIACRAVVSHRIPDGSAYMYHSQDRHINVPISETSKTRGGTDNSVTRIMIKPTHLIGGYAQLSYGFNYYGAIGSQRDELTIIRKRTSEVTY
ncbi:nitrate reductase subunit alpha [Lapillicoccus sp.]|uniref:nitrate reductase subunit alpha n=1 Tax=Lapillicoccus sp. TaxID=1909287 RepID=UPI0039833E20